MPYEFSFQRLEVWQLARTLAKDIYKLTKKFPREELYGLTSQLRRASVSVASNIAEGSSRKSAKHQAHFTEIAYGSLIEVLNQLFLASDFGYIDFEQLEEIKLMITKLANKLTALRRKQLERAKH